ncbi:type VI secretion system secreted protein VgrG [Cognatiyoonia koreensis]|uniref:Type VI secretion system secreted protein VgrG n=1 Tax=Cognatiyoonia koreensis TaxID=364200 RepID=A0A1I0RS87_9RHOB|nr:type VI secretion system tip protein TssI/VgrG [Cognatiyoonia koreensis]SEW44141.1 type VI secretion system secreted protein VgrG [Cognatiyoonia koreensis]
MNAPFKQDLRLGRLTTDLGKDVLVLLRFGGTDHLNGLFEYAVEALSTKQNIDFDALIGTHASIEIDSQNDGPRHFDGIVTQAKWAGVGENGNRYELTLRPWFWLAGRRRNQRIFHEMTVLEIVEKLLSAYSGLGKPHLTNRCKGSYPKLEYTVQYRESDLDFATRLLERFGISYHFCHAPGNHTLVLTDTIEEHDPLAGTTREYKPVDGNRQAGKEHFWEWYPERNLTTGAMRLTDYNFKTPTAAMEVDRVGDAAYEQGQIESYDYPGDYLEQGEGKGVVGLRTLQERGHDRRHRAVGDCTSLGAGMTVTLTGDQVPGVKDQDYLCLTATHSYVSDAYGSGGHDSDGYAYSGQYVLMPTTAPLAPERKTQLPIIQGPQTAVVVGDGEIDCDEYGRILVHFHWDLEKAYSMRCRVSQNWASKGWGGMVIPRIGMEVIVEHLEGDPDKPIVTGCVYNGKNDVPYPLPEHKTKSVFRSDSHKSEGFNEFTFEDATGNENISLHAQKDQTLKILHDRSKRVDHDQIESVGNNKSIDVGKNHAEKIGGSMNLSIGSGAGMALFAGLAGLMSTSSAAMKNASNESGDSFVSQITQGMSKMSTAAEALSLPVNKGFKRAGEHRKIAGLAQVNAGAAVGALVGQIMPVGGIKNTIVEKAVIDTVGLARTEQIGLMKNTFVGKVQNTVVGEKKNIEVGETSTTTVGKHMEINVGDDFIITVGKSRLIMTKEGTIVLQGVKIEIEGEKQIRAQSKLIDLN